MWRIVLSLAIILSCRAAEPPPRSQSIPLDRSVSKEGLQWRWYSDGSLHSLRLYLHDRPVGLHVGLWPNGRVKFVYLFVNGWLEGPALDWHENGRPFMNRHYAAGRESGLQKAWGPQGQLFSSFFVKGEKRYGLVGSKPCFTVH